MIGGVDLTSAAWLGTTTALRGHASPRANFDFLVPGYSGLYYHPSLGTLALLLFDISLSVAMLPPASSAKVPYLLGLLFTMFLNVDVSICTSASLDPHATLAMV